ncbi:MAG: CBS domain-containing protein, partial [Thaumarchaeota archaeon]|nr:CBS domain-containing protein [Nitrososphaerota archaeon]
HTVLPQDYLFTVIQKMNSHPFDIIPVIDPSKDGKVVGIVTNEGIMNLLTENKQS